MGSNYYEQRNKYSDKEYIETYQKYHSSTKAAKELGVNYMTVIRALRRNGIDADGRKYNYGRNQKITDEQLLESISEGLTRNEIADKYDVHVANIDKRMNKLGIHAIYELRTCHSVFEDCWHYMESHDQKVKFSHPLFIYVESRRIDSKHYKIRLQCRKCGCVLERSFSRLRGNITCEACDKKKRGQQKALDKKRADLVRIFIALKELKSPKICECCGEEFYSLYAESLYCSEKCKRKAKKLRWKARYPQKAKERSKLHRSKYKERAKKYGGIYESGITRIKVVERDNYICQICGKTCNPEDNRWGSFGPDYPTLDHIIPLSKGGSHTWDNVQCACGMCNSTKSDSLELREEESA